MREDVKSALARMREELGDWKREAVRLKAKWQEACQWFEEFQGMRLALKVLSEALGTQSRLDVAQARLDESRSVRKWLIIIALSAIAVSALQCLLCIYILWGLHI